VLFKHLNRFQEYLIDCSAADIRGAFSRMLVVLATSTPPPDSSNVDQVAGTNRKFH